MSDLGQWKAMTLDETQRLLRNAPFPWWVAGGHALELFTGSTWRSHVDLDIGFIRSDGRRVRDYLSSYDIWIFTSGAVAPWDGAPLDAGQGHHNLWCRRSPGAPWCLDLTAFEGDDHRWVLRDNPMVALDWADAVLHSPTGIPFLTPELTLMTKSSENRPKDNLDALNTILRLAGPQRERLDQWLPRGHSWRKHLGEVGDVRGQER